MECTNCESKPVLRSTSGFSSHSNPSPQLACALVTATGDVDTFIFSILHIPVHLSFLSERLGQRPAANYRSWHCDTLQTLLFVKLVVKTFLAFSAALCFIKKFRTNFVTNPLPLVFSQKSILELGASQHLRSRLLRLQFAIIRHFS